MDGSEPCLRAKRDATDIMSILIQPNLLLLKETSRPNRRENMDNRS